MKIQSLQIFIDILETGSFVATAKRLHTVQSNITAHVKKLESELEVTLFHRKGQLAVTPAGKALADYAKRILNSHDEALGLFLGDKTVPTKLHIGAMETTTAVRLPPILSSFHQNHPAVTLTLDTGPSAELISNLIKGHVDGIFVAGSPEHGQLHSIKAFTEELVLVGAKPLSKFPSSEQLLNSTFLAFRQGCSYRQRIELLLASMGISTTKIFDFGSIDGILGCIAAGMGYTLMPLSTIEAHRHRFNVDYIAIPSAKIRQVDTYFVTAQPDTWTPSLAHFIEVLAQHKHRDERPLL